MANRSVRLSWRLFLLLVFCFVTGIAASLYIQHILPSNDRLPPDYHGVAKPIFFDGHYTGIGASGEKSDLALPLVFLQEYIDNTIQYEKDSGAVIITTPQYVLLLKPNEREAMVNDRKVALKTPVTKNGATLYIPVDILNQYVYSLDILESEETGAVIVRQGGDNLRWGVGKPDVKVPETVYSVRSEPSIKAPIRGDLVQGESALIWGEEGDWYSVQQVDGTLGFIQKKDFTPERTEIIKSAGRPAAFTAWKPVGSRINLTWQQVYNKKHPLTDGIPEMPGLNVFSPQWFNLEDSEGHVASQAAADFADWVRGRGYQLWPIFNNGFDPDRTHVALSTYELRMTMIRQLLAYAKTYQLHGINIDFENVYLKDKENMVQFIREMAPMLHEQGITLSIDVTVKASSETYSLFMDRKAVAQSVDYMIVMGYDEHWASSPEAGSVASLPWVENGIARIIQEDEVPPEKLILGVPFYTRIWSEGTKDGKTIVTSQTAKMSSVQQIIQDNKLTPELDEASGQHYVQYQEDGKTKKIWIEDAFSMQKRLDLITKYDLGGVASWSRSMETSDIWPLMEKALQLPTP
ncbi:glycosyl hydrolase family 18 protein [Gorillibacterium massiliense]|uniref:glycosyl hydrolase family 18 protein n=1 Tax=Gorillibacterium massiliense TaxID=1280390 RepID=UPI0004B86EF3|nr:glycosyl hydrolase family 18 protein [Gorillibacterium massiliense]